jgi:lysine-ketoglutarate reductase/saccharopine dehydrogenase-like protein (TIGR00300 family)
MNRYADRKAVVVGGTHGMGLATARALIDGGARVLLTGNSEANVERVKAELGSNAVVVRSDVSSPAEIDALADTIPSTLGSIDALFAGNGVAAHDIESNMFGTSLGVYLKEGGSAEHGHEHHIRAINTIRSAGSIADAVSTGVLRKGIMHALVKHGKQYVLVGSVRDDGPLPDVYTDVIEGQRAMRACLPEVGFAIMVATMLHSIATGNLLPAKVPLVSVDINPATVTKLADRGSAQAIGIITDIGLFCEQLAGELVVGYKRE